MLKKTITALALVAIAVMAAGQSPQKKDDKSVHHAAMHAEHTVHNNGVKAEKWLDHHVSAPHKAKHRAMKMKKRKKMHLPKPMKMEHPQAVKNDDKSPHHAAMHAEHTVHNNAMKAEKWIDKHVSAPHKKTGGN